MQLHQGRQAPTSPPGPPPPPWFHFWNEWLINQRCLFRWFKFTLNHLIASGMKIYDWPFGTLPFRLFGSNLDTRDLETYPRTYSGHFWNMSIFDDSRAVWVLFRKWVVSENQSFLDEGAIVIPLIGLVLGGEVPRLNHGPICFPFQNTKGGATGHRKLSTTFLTLSQRIKAHLLLMYCIKNLSIGVS